MWGRVLSVATFTIGLGIVDRVDPEAREVTLQTPLTSTQGVDALRLGDMALDLQSFADQYLESPSPHFPVEVDAPIVDEDIKRGT